MRSHPGVIRHEVRNGDAAVGGLAQVGDDACMDHSCLCRSLTLAYV